MSRKKQEMKNDKQEADECTELPTPPDGGWGWVICFASFVCNILVDGVCFSAGIFYLEFLDYYKESKGKTAWVGSVLNGMYLTMGPIAGGLANKYGCRAVSIAGSIIAAVGLFASTFAPNINVLIILYGGLGGIGFGLMYLPAIVMVGFYFEKKRAFATGIAVCGSGIGAFIFAPMCRLLIETYSWKGATWIISGIVLNGIVMGFLYRPLPTVSKECRKQRFSNGYATEESEKLMKDEHTCRETNHVQPNYSRDPSQCLTIQSNMDIPTAMRGEQDSRNARLYKSNDCIHEATRLEHLKRDLQRPLYRKDIFYSGSIQNLAAYKKNPKAYRTSITNIKDIECEGTTPKSKFQSICKTMTDVVTVMFDFSLMKNPVFVLYGLSCFLCMTGFFVPFIYLPDHAQSLGVNKDNGAFLISILGIANTLGRIACGWVSDQSWADCLIINNVALIIGGLGTIALPFLQYYGLLATYSVVFGLCIAVFVSLRSIIMVELIGLDKLTNAFGLVTLCQGLSSFIGAPIAGFLFDLTGDYSVSFYVAGATVALAGIICIPLRRVANWQDKKLNIVTEVEL